MTMPMKRVFLEWKPLLLVVKYWMWLFKEQPGFPVLARVKVAGGEPRQPDD